MRCPKKGGLDLGILQAQKKFQNNFPLLSPLLGHDSPQKETPRGVYMRIGRLGRSSYFCHQIDSAETCGFSRRRKRCSLLLSIKKRRVAPPSEITFTNSGFPGKVSLANVMKRFYANSTDATPHICLTINRRAWNWGGIPRCLYIRS
jgi:hypothetical protein